MDPEGLALQIVGLAGAIGNLGFIFGGAFGFVLSLRAGDLRFGLQFTRGNPQHVGTETAIIKNRPTFLEANLGSVIDRWPIKEACRRSGRTLFTEAEGAAG